MKSMDTLSNQIFKEEYVNVFNYIPQNAINLICIDPPYNLNQASWDKEIDWRIIAEKSDLLLKENGNFITFSGWSSVYTIIEFCHTWSNLRLKNWITWDRQKAKNPGRKNFTSTREEILWFVKSDNYIFNQENSLLKKKTKGYGLKNGVEYRRLSNIWYDIGPVSYMSKEYTGYKTQKPLLLMERLIKIFSNEHDIVLDYFCGSGTTGVACKNLNRHYILSDNNPEAIVITKERLH